ncbi:MAG: GAF domain-containing protein [Anaerolineae bacterium]
MVVNSPQVRSNLDTLYRITHEFDSQLELDRVLERVLSAVVATLNVHDASLLIFDSRGTPEKFLIADQFEVRQISLATINTTIQHGTTYWVRKYREEVLIEDTTADPRWFSDETTPEIGRARSAIALPVQLQEQFIGVLTVTAGEPGYFNEDDLAILRIIADQSAFALHNDRLIKAEQKRRRLADTLASVAHTINSTLDLYQVLNLILEQLALVIDYDTGSVLLLEGDTLSVRAARGFEDMEDALHVVITLDDTEQPNYQAVLRKHPILINDVDTVTNWIKSPSSQKVRSWIGAPLIARDEVIGMLTVDSHQVNKYTNENVQEIAAFAEQVATAMSNAQIVAQLRNMEDSYTILFEDSADMSIITDYYGQIMNANRKACQMLRRTKEALIGSPISLIDRRLNSILTENIKRLKAWREVSLELDITDAYHETISLEVNARHVDYGGKECVQWVGRDISVRKQSEKMRQDLINMLVHDLRGPVGNLVNTIELLPMLLRSITEDPKISTFLELAKRSGQEVRDLIDSMLDVGRLEAGEIYLQRSMVDLADIIQAIKDQVTPRATSKKMGLAFHLPPSLPEVWIDRGMIRRVLINLTDNAIKYTPHQGRVSLTISQDHNSLHFAVADNGPGIGKEHQARIFNKFSRVDHSSSAPSGVGLGLAFCKLAVEAHGGTIWVESEGVAGHGSTFHFSIPMLTPPEE